MSHLTAGGAMLLGYRKLSVPLAISRNPGLSASGRPARRHLLIQAGIRARWCIDIRYGFKLDAVALMQEWVQDIGSQAGLSPSNARINSGAVGVPESRLELEVEFNSFAELEDFWAAIPATDHKAWSQRMQNLVVHGSPAWEVYRTCPLPVASAYGEETTAASSSLLVPPSASTPPPRAATALVGMVAGVGRGAGTCGACGAWGRVGPPAFYWRSRLRRMLKNTPCTRRRQRQGATRGLRPAPRQQRAVVLGMSRWCWTGKGSP